MTRITRIVNGFVEAVDVTLGIDYYDESILVTNDIGNAGTGYDSTHTIFTLPNSETYDGTIKQLEVEVNGVGQVEGVDYDYGGTTTDTAITFTRAMPQNARVRLRKVFS